MAGGEYRNKKCMQMVNIGTRNVWQIMNIETRNE